MYLQVLSAIQPLPESYSSSNSKTLLPIHYLLVLWQALGLDMAIQERILVVNISNSV